MNTTNEIEFEFENAQREVELWEAAYSEAKRALLDAQEELEKAEHTLSVKRSIMQRLVKRSGYCKECPPDPGQSRRVSCARPWARSGTAIAGMTACTTLA